MSALSCPLKSKAVLVIKGFSLFSVSKPNQPSLIICYLSSFFENLMYKYMIEFIERNLLEDNEF